MTGITGLDLVCVPVSDHEAARAFFVGALGFRVVRDEHPAEGQRWIELHPGGTGSAIALVDWIATMPPGSLKGLVLGTDDLAGTHRHLTGSGVRLSEIRAAPWGRYATFEDPDGNGWILQELGPHEP